MRIVLVSLFVLFGRHSPLGSADRVGARGGRLCPIRVSLAGLTSGRPAVSVSSAAGPRRKMPFQR